MKGLYSVTYLPPVSYLNSIKSCDEIIIDRHEHFVKQTYRNRANIYGANGKLPLIIPVEHENLFRLTVSEVRISNETRWKNIHWRSICSAYRKSPYFEYYENDFKIFYENKSEYLFEFNIEILKTIFRLFNIKTEIRFSDSYQDSNETENDLRNKFTPKIIQPVPEYYQTFQDKHGFIPDLACIDHLFNEGPNSLIH